MEGSEATIGRSVAPAVRRHLRFANSTRGYWHVHRILETRQCRRNLFGEDVYVMVIVSDEASTDTATATPMPTIVSPTATPTFTAASPALTSTATAVSRPTATTTPTATSPDLTPTATAARLHCDTYGYRREPDSGADGKRHCHGRHPDSHARLGIRWARAATTPLTTQNG